MKCPRVKDNGEACGGQMTEHGFDKETGTVRWVCEVCKFEETLQEGDVP